MDILCYAFPCRRTAMDCGDVQCTPLVFLTFLQQQSCSSAELRIELDSLARELKLTQDINGNGLGLNIHEEGELQTDGHFCSSSSILLEGLEPQAAPAWPGELVCLRFSFYSMIEIPSVTFT